MTIDYVLPLRWTSDEALAELTAYLRGLSAIANVIVVDGSAAGVFAAHDAAWRDIRLTHVRPDPRYRYANGKVAGVHTGIALAESDRVVIADDDVRYDEHTLRAVATLLESAVLVRPQNYFDPLPWHARWDTARSLVNRAFGGDWPGTLGIRRSAFERAGGYDGDVLFENLELVRTIRAGGGEDESALGVYVARRPPTAQKFFSQRVRQAYDELARPLLLALWLAVGPAVLLAGWPGAVVAAATVTALAEAGRRRAGGTHVFPWSTTLFAPLWLAERAVTSWIALAWRIAGGVPYAGGRIIRAATPPREIRRRMAPGQE
jgi:hypothetical protein